MTTNRKYPSKDVDMLTVCATIVENAIANQKFLVSKRRNWVEPFFSYLKSRIDNAFKQFLGIDSASEQRKATQTVTKIQTTALNDLAELKIQIEEDFKGDKPYRDEILKTLGYADYHKQAQARDQEALIQLLYRFRTNLTKELFDEIVAKGTDEATLIQIRTYADQMAEANITQETLKGSRKTITEEALTEFNTIYEEVISIAKIARNFYKGNPAKQDEFSYNKILKKLNAPARTANEEQKEENL
ncbi:hypothetical protein LJB92_02730 [Bacteroidales bacterium OttesenSCG-928-M06]|nr:hypothetical protein [Bacteroidales bacterium OttesenSCG-928-M06]